MSTSRLSRCATESKIRAAIADQLVAAAVGPGVGAVDQPLQGPEEQARAAKTVASHQDRAAAHRPRRRRTDLPEPPRYLDFTPIDSAPAN